MRSVGDTLAPVEGSQAVVALPRADAGGWDRLVGVQVDSAGPGALPPQVLAMLTLSGFVVAGCSDGVIRVGVAGSLILSLVLQMWGGHRAVRVRCGTVQPLCGTHSPSLPPSLPPFLSQVYQRLPTITPSIHAVRSPSSPCCACGVELELLPGAIPPVHRFRSTMRPPSCTQPQRSGPRVCTSLATRRR
jgi:hypothetical protein